MNKYVYRIVVRLTCKLMVEYKILDFLEKILHVTEYEIDNGRFY